MLEFWYGIIGSTELWIKTAHKKSLKKKTH
jgi:hypothetical protein